MNKAFYIIFFVLLLFGCNQDNNKKTEESSIKMDTSLFKVTVNETNNEDVKKDAENIIRWADPSSIDTTFTASSNIQITLSNTDSISFSEDIISLKSIDSLSAIYKNSHQKALAIEKLVGNRFQNFIKRDSTGLNVKLKSGDWKLVGINQSLNETDNTFEYFFENEGFYSIRVQWGEGNGYKLVSYNNGKVINLPGQPYFSPNGNYLISVNVDLEAQYSFNGFQIFERKDEAIKPILKFSPDGWGSFSAEWINDSSLVLKNKTIEVQNGEWNYIDFYTLLEINKAF